MMAKSKTTLQISKQYYAKQDHDHITVQAVDSTGLNDFVNRLHEAMDFYQLFDTFIDELGSVIPCDSIEYMGEDSQISLVNGVSGQQRCSYAIKYDSLSLGNIAITRDTKFLEHELKIIETMLAGLTLPLRNALRYQQAIRFAQRDGLTGLRNSSYYYDFFELEIQRAHRYNKSFSLLKIDLDDFEAINNQYGNDAGDAILYEVATRIVKQSRSCDIVYRNGGDEFLVFLPNTEKVEAIIAANRIKDFVLASSFVYEKNDIAFTLSAGVVTVAREDTASTLIARVGKALFHAKILGKNRIYGDLSTENMSAGYA
jgi:diguanylate cyclase (GGDEF)-like protein